MKSSEILAKLIEQYPELLPWSDKTIGEKTAHVIACELIKLLGSWDGVNRYLPQEHPSRKTPEIGRWCEFCAGTGQIPIDYEENETPGTCGFCGGSGKL